ncbi:MAG: hypothetical protein ABW318_09275 [Vicinamibacterales bacterium]
MTRILGLSLIFGTIVLPALSEEAVDPATVTCKDYFTASHQGMYDISSVVHKAMKDDPKLSALNETDFDIKVDQVCKAHPDAKVMDAFHSYKG